MLPIDEVGSMDFGVQSERVERQMDPLPLQLEYVEMLQERRTARRARETRRAAPDYAD